ncbi:MAG: TetR/AcrR family transcriptional regulator [Candidatus Poribacteria bacterium]
MNKDQKYEIIIEKSRELFGRFGFKKTTMDDISNACGIAKATLYYYFENKQEIFKSVIKKEFEMFIEKTSKILSEIDEPHEKLRAFVLARVSRVEEISNYYSTIRDEYIEHYAFIEEERKAFISWEIETIKSILNMGIQKGVFKDMDTMITATVIAFALKGLEYPWIIRQYMIDIEKAVDLMLPILFKGLDKK